MPRQKFLWLKLRNKVLKISTRGYHYFNKGRYAQAELIVNDENQTLARYPNSGTISVPTDNVDTDNFGFRYTDERVSK